MDAAKKCHNVKYTWELVSQFVCWEFCRNINFNGGLNDTQRQTDLFKFFRDMVIRMTTKQFEHDITPHEIVAKFIEELNILANSSNPQERMKVIVKLAEILKRLCAELRPAIKDLLSLLQLKLFVVKESGTGDLVNDEQLWDTIRKFSVEAYRFLPLPELLRASYHWKKQSEEAKTMPTKENIIERLKIEGISSNEVPEILKFIEEDKMYQNIINKNNVQEIVKGEPVEVQTELDMAVDPEVIHIGDDEILKSIDEIVVESNTVGKSSNMGTVLPATLKKDDIVNSVGKDGNEVEKAKISDEVIVIEEVMHGVASKNDVELERFNGIIIKDEIVIEEEAVENRIIVEDEAEINVTFYNTAKEAMERLKEVRIVLPCLDKIKTESNSDFSQDTKKTSPKRKVTRVTRSSRKRELEQSFKSADPSPTADLSLNDNKPLDMKFEMSNFKRRNKHKIFWTLQEEELLYKGIKKYGFGNWNLIKADGGLDRRSNLDLRDKWRNVIMHKHLSRIEERIKDKEQKYRI